MLIKEISEQLVSIMESFSFGAEIQIPHIGVNTNESNSISPIALLHFEQIITLVS